MTDFQNQISRRQFIKGAGAVAGLSVLGTLGGFTQSCAGNQGRNMNITIASVDSNFEREPLLRPFGFKGSAMTEVWQVGALLESESGTRKFGLGCQNVLWSDSSVFAAHSESGGNALMYAITERALQIANGMTFQSPINLLEEILPEVYEYAKQITNNPDLRKTFALNALVGFDNAAWLLYAEENGITDFDTMVPSQYRPALSHKHDRVASVPAISYATPLDEMVELVDQGYFLMKIKIGHAGTQQEMLEKDKERLLAIHDSIGDRETDQTPDGKIPYYLDANGRYESKDALLEIIDYTKKIGMHEQILCIEEPFPEPLQVDVSDVDAVIVSDESAHTDEDALERIEMGYSAIALKDIAKTLSMTLKIAKVAYERDIPLLCADLTVNPFLVDWNKNIAARLEGFPGLGDMNLMENNGHQNYRDWERLETYHPCNGASWTEAQNGVFMTNDDFYERSGCIFEQPEHYAQMFQHQTM